MKTILDTLTAALPAAALPDYDCNNGAWMRLIRNASQKDYTDTLQAALNAGFRPFAKNTLEGNMYETLVRSDAVAHIYYCPTEKTLRVIADPNTTLFDPAPTPYTRRCETKLWQFETLKKIGLELNESQFDKIKEEIQNASDSAELAAGRKRAKEEAWMHIGQAGKNIANYMITTVEEQNKDSQRETA